MRRTRYKISQLNLKIVGEYLYNQNPSENNFILINRFQHNCLYIY